MPEFDDFLKPISAEKPAGENVRLDGADLTLSQLEEMRTAVDGALDPSGESRAQDWKGVVRLCEETLTTRTKDLEIAAYYTQGLAYTEGWGGLLKGLRIVRGLVEEFWESVHPGWDDGEIVEPIRARPINWLASSREFLTAVKKIRVTDPIGGTQHTWFDYEQSKRVDSAAIHADQGPYQELIASGLISGEQWRGSLGGTPPERVEAVQSALREVIAEIAALDKACEDRFEEDPPYMMELVQLLEEIQDYLEQYQASGGVAQAEAQPAPQAAAASAAATPAAAAAPTNSGVAAAAGPIATRDDAYRRLREVAEYLRKTEPHSPVPALLDRAVRWGNMSFEKLFDDVVKNREARTQTRDLLGLEAASDPNPGAAPAESSARQRMNDSSPKRLS